jgi:hypothetical protein
VVDADGAGLHLLGDTLRAFGIGRPDGSAQAELGVVGDPDRLVVAVVGDDRQDRAEDLLLGDDRGVVDVGEDGRLNEPAVVDVGSPAAGDEGGAVGDAAFDVGLDGGAVCGADHRADLGGRVECVAHDCPFGEGLVEVDDFGVAASGRQDAGAGEAGLPVVEQ